ncbi:MAG: hypothetical protein U0263_19800 [Polyangiaceae bacterium]
MVDGVTVYLDAFGSGSHTAIRTRADGLEDFIAFPTAPTTAELTYRVLLHSAAGLRLVGNTLELVDGAGMPRLRMAPPWLVDRDGVRHDARVGVQGCAVDRDPRAPWDHAPVSPGAVECSVHIDWRGASVRYPAWMDPAWTTTGGMSTARVEAASMLLPSGDALVAGGSAGASSAVVVALASSEAYSASGGVWAAMSPMGTARARPAFAKLSNGKLLVAGGAASNAAALSGSEIYDPGTGLWSPQGGLSAPRVWAEMVPLGTGALLVGGKTSGYYGSDGVTTAERFNASTGTWSTVHAMTNPRYGTFILAPVGSTKVLVSGGWTPWGPGVTDNQTVAEAELYDSGADNWGSLPAPLSRASRTWAPLPNGKLLIAAGATKPTVAGAGGPALSAEIFDPANNTFSPAGSLTYPSASYRTPAAFVLGNQDVVVPLGVNNGGLISERYVPATGQWVPACATGDALVDAAVVPLADGRTLVAGGRVNDALSAAAFLHATTAGCECDSQCGGAAPKCAPTNDPKAGQCVGCLTSADCSVATAPACVLGTSSYDCTACNGDNGASTTAPCPTSAQPACQADGSCKQCSANNSAACGASTPACDVASGTCAACTADFQSPSQPKMCPTASNPWCDTSAGTCGKCTQDSDCAGHAGGSVCNTVSGACVACNGDADCASTEYCASHVCTAKLADGESCTGANQCLSGACTSGKCGVPSDGGTGGAAGASGAGGTAGAGGAGGTGATGGATGGTGGAIAGGGTGGGATGGTAGKKATTDSGDDGGCGCRTAERGPSAPYAAWLAGIGLAMSLRRSRRRTR